MNKWNIESIIVEEFTWVNHGRIEDLLERAGGWDIGDGAGIQTRWANWLFLWAEERMASRTKRLPDANIQRTPLAEEIKKRSCECL